MGIAEKLLANYAGAQWSLDGDTYGGLTWIGPGEKPTEAVISALEEPAFAFTVYKGDIWRRCSDAEAAQLDGAIVSQPVRLRRLFDDAQFLRSDDELFGRIRGAVTQMLGATRAAVILAASE